MMSKFILLERTTLSLQSNTVHSSKPGLPNAIQKGSHYSEVLNVLREICVDELTFFHEQ